MRPVSESVAASKRATSYASALRQAMTASAAIASSVRRSSSVTRRMSVKPTDSAPLSSPSHDHGDAGGGLDLAQRLVRGLDLGPVRVGDERLAGRQDAAGDALAAAEDDAGPVLGRVVAGGGDAAAQAVGQVDAGELAAEREVGLARERLQHLHELERGAQRRGRAGQRGVALGAGGAAALGLEQREGGRGLIGERLGQGDLVGAQRARRRG